MSYDLDSFLLKMDLVIFLYLVIQWEANSHLKYIDMFEDKIDKLIIVDIANKTYRSNRFEHVFEAIYSISLDKIKSRTEADSLSSPIIKNEGEKKFYFKKSKKNS